MSGKWREEIISRRKGWISPITCPEKAGTDKLTKLSHCAADLIGDLWEPSVVLGGGSLFAGAGAEDRKEADIQSRILWEKGWVREAKRSELQNRLPVSNCTSCTFFSHSGP